MIGAYLIVCMIMVSVRRHKHSERTYQCAAQNFKVIVLYLVGHMVTSLRIVKALFAADYTENKWLRKTTLSLGVHNRSSSSIPV